MPTEATTTGAAAASTGASGGSTGGSSAGSGGAASSPAPVQSDLEFLQSTHPQTETSETKEAPKTEAVTTDKSTDEINLSVLEPGQPKWLGKVTDPAAKTEIQKLLDYQKKVGERFKDSTELDAFFKDLPGGKEQIAALQMLSKEVGEIDTHIAENKPEGNAIVASRYLGEAPDGGVGLFRAGAQHLAKTQPEAWAQIGQEVVNESLKAANIGADFPTLVGAIQEMRQAIQKDDGEALGKAMGKLLGEPKADAVSSADPRLTRAQQAEKDARAAETKALGETWQSRDTKIGDAFKQNIYGRVEKIFSNEKFMPKSVNAETRAELTGKIYSEVLSQIVSNSYTRAQVTQLIGIASGSDLSKANLRAAQGDFDKALDLIKTAANEDMVNRAVAKVVSAYAKERAATNASTREAAKSAVTHTDVGNSSAGKTSGYRPITEKELVDLSDEELLQEYSKRRGAYA